MTDAQNPGPSADIWAVDTVIERRSSARTLRLTLDRFGQRSIIGCAALLGMGVDDFLSLAALCCSTGLSTGHRAWPVPSFSGLGRPEDVMEVSVSLPEEDWKTLEQEAARQKVGLERLLHHAALCLMADLDRATTALR